MSRLLTLPTEVLQNIIGQVNPDDLVNFSVSCKHIFHAAERHLLKHRERIKTYSELRYNGCFRHGDDDHPVKFLREICLNEHIAFYPRSLNIECCGYPASTEHLLNNVYLPEEKLLGELLLEDLDLTMVREVYDHFESAIDEKLSRALRYNDRDVNFWSHRLKRSTRSATLCLLLLLLPNLEELHFLNFECKGAILKNMLELIAAGNDDPDPLSGPLALTKLSKVFVRGDEHYYSQCRVLVPLLALPSLRTLTAKSVFSDYESWAQLDWPYDQHISGLTVLNLQSSFLSATDFSRLLGGIKGLKSFTYDAHFMSADDFGGVPVRSIIGMLLEHAKHSLESVTFTGLWDGRCEDDHGSGSFKDFEVLEQIRIHSCYYLKDVKAYEDYHGQVYPRYSKGESFSDKEMIFSLWYDDVQRLVNLLPASVRTVEIDGDVDVADVTTLLKELPKRKAECVPHLKSINFISCPPWDQENDYSLALAYTWREECQKVGVDLLL